MALDLFQVDLSEKSEQSKLQWHEVAQRPSEQWSLEVNLFCQNGFESYYKFMHIMLCREQHEISLTVLLINGHDIGRILNRWIMCQTGMKSPLKWHLLFINQENKIKDFSKV